MQHAKAQTPAPHPASPPAADGKQAPPAVDGKQAPADSADTAHKQEEAPPVSVDDSVPPQAAPDAPSVTPPVAIESPAAKYPPALLPAQRSVTVDLAVTVEADGRVGAVQVLLSAGPDFDAAAIAAVNAWKFSPARRGDQAVASRIRVPFHFEPSHEIATDPAPPPVSAPVAAPSAAADDAADVVVSGDRAEREEERSASDYQLERDVIAAAPRAEGAEVLRSAPGLYIGRGEGAGVAHNYMLRGFDAAHGQDIEFHVGGLPINLPSHIHGQGYADLSFLIGDVTQELHITEGVSDPRQGDFAVAGSIDVGLGVAEVDRGVTLRSSYGSFDTFRQLALWAPKDAADETFAAAMYTRTDGFGENRDGQGGSAIVQHRFGEGDVTYRWLTILNASRYSSAGVLRQEDVNAGSVCFYCVYPEPTATAQNALNSRFLGGFFADYDGDEGANGQAGIWLGYDNFRTQQNFTGYIETSQVLGVSGRGDLIEQQNETFSVGLTGRYRTQEYRAADWAHGTLELGTDARVDVVDQAQNLLDAQVRNQTWDERVAAGIVGTDLGLWGDLDWAFGHFVRARLGVRADMLSYDVEDRLGNFAPVSRPQDTYVVGFRRSAVGVAVGPRTSVEVLAREDLSFLAAYGEGYRSPQARTLEEGESAPFSKVRSADLGARFTHGDAWNASLSGYYTHLSDDVAFDASEGRLERIGATQRWGAVAYTETRPLPGVVGALSVTYVNATLLEPPPPTPQEPSPPFTEGQALPFVAPVVLRADAAVRRTLLENLAAHSLDGRLGAGFSFLAERPLPYGEYAAPVALLDMSAGLFWGPLELSLELFNLFDTRYAAVEYNFPSDWDPSDGVRPRTPARHFSAGAPFTGMLSLGVHL